MPRPLRVLITNLEMASRTGAVTFTRDLALGLQRAGHGSAVLTSEVAEIGGELREASIPVVTRASRLPWRPDVLHLQHLPVSFAALYHFPDVPALFMCHNAHDSAWREIPPVPDAIQAMVAVDANCAERLARLLGPDRAISIVHNAVDLQRFQRRAPLPDVPRSAAVFSNRLTPGPRLDAVRAACAAAGLSLDLIGSGMGHGVARPEAVLPRFDVVFAKARCALEALASGAAVILFDNEGLGPMVTRARLSELREWNFGWRLLTGEASADAIRTELARYDPVDAAQVTDSIRAGAGVEAMIDRLVALYGRLIDTPAHRRRHRLLARFVWSLATDGYLPGFLRHEIARSPLRRRGTGEQWH